VENFKFCIFLNFLFEAKNKTSQNHVHVESEFTATVAACPLRITWSSYQTSSGCGRQDTHFWTI